MSATPIKLSDLQQAINDRLSSLDYLKTPIAVPIINADAHDLNTMIEQALGNIGITILIGQPRLKNIETDASEKKPANVSFSFEIAIGENVILNRDPAGTANSKLPCMDVMMAIYQRIHGWTPNYQWKKFTIPEAMPVQDKKRQAYSITAITEKTLPPI